MTVNLTATVRYASRLTALHALMREHFETAMAEGNVNRAVMLTIRMERIAGVMHGIIAAQPDEDEPAPEPEPEPVVEDYDALAPYNGRAGFTPFAKEKMLDATGHAKDYVIRHFILGGQHADGARYRRELRETTTAVFIEYAKDGFATHLWVQWTDGRRHLVHRKEG